MLFCPSTDQTVQGVANAAALILCHSTRWCDWKKQLILPWHLLRDVFWILWGCNPSYNIGHSLLCHYHFLFSFVIAYQQHNPMSPWLPCLQSGSGLSYDNEASCNASNFPCIRVLMRCFVCKTKALAWYYFSDQGGLWKCICMGNTRQLTQSRVSRWHLHNLSKLRPK